VTFVHDLYAKQTKPVTVQRMKNIYALTE